MAYIAVMSQEFLGIVDNLWSSPTHLFPTKIEAIYLEEVLLRVEFPFVIQIATHKLFFYTELLELALSLHSINLKEEFVSA